LCAVGNWVLVVGNWLGKTRASLVPVYGVLLGGFAWWAVPAGSVWRGVAVAVVVLDPGTWMIALAAAEDVAKRVFGRGGKDAQDGNDAQDGEDAKEGEDGEGGPAAARQDGDGGGADETTKRRDEGGGERTLFSDRNGG